MIKIYYVFFYHRLNIFRIIYMLNPSFSPLSDVPRVRLRARVDMSMSCHQGRVPTPSKWYTPELRPKHGCECCSVDI